MKLLPIVKALEGETGRLTRLKKVLRKHRINFRSHKYATGENILIGKGDVLFVAHHDVVRGPGANDDASAMAVLVGLLKKRKAAVVIFDEEEKFCIGAEHYIKKFGLPRAVIDLELMGIGDMFAIWTVTEERPMLKKIRKALRRAKLQFEEAKRVPFFWADFTAFRNAGLKDAWCLTLLPSSERRLVRAFVLWRSLFVPVLKVFGKTPKIFKHYHSKHDNSSSLSESALQVSLKAVIAVYDELS